ncbi:response regulator transcription factor [Enterococcus sp. RIT-PI-f]|uniref:response regulator transcription factor n=1 Tax=Enterococcus sp. RIT-PI-f TaxID=1690244 RepID=UPI0006B8EE81|nr:response regulator transcription factor [Enterococcus sp. RIT-PI-f]KPG69753.1 response regulator [Enterococcus sp. RIT-PI-f]
MKINIVLLDDHQLVLEGLRNSLQRESAFEVVGAYNNVKDFFLCLKHQPIDVIVMDMMLKDCHAFDLIPTIQKEITQVPKLLLISGFYDELIHQRAIELGVNAFLRKEASYDELIHAVMTISNGNTILPVHLLKREEQRLLTSIEIEVLNLVANEMTNEKIAKQLYISRRTVETHVATICNKLSVNTRIGAVREGIRLNLVK